MMMFALLLTSGDPSWLLAAEEVAVLEGHVVVGQCPDTISLLAQSALGIADLVILGPDLLDIDRPVTVRLRRLGLMVVQVGGFPGVAPSFATVEAALDGASAASRASLETRKADLVVVCGCKGSPGATRFALDLAQALARPSGRDGAVSLLDLDPRGGDIATYLGLPSHPNLLTATDAIEHGQPLFDSVNRQG